MNTSSTFPDDLMMEYDLLQFMENDDASARAMGTQATSANTTAAQFQFLNVDDLLGNAGIVLDSLDATPHQQPTVGAPTLSNKPTTNNSNECDELSAGASSLLDDLFIDGDDLLAHLESEAASVEQATCISPCPSHVTDVSSSSPAPSAVYNTPPPDYFDDLESMTKIDTSISPVCTPVTSMAHTTRHSLAIPHSPSQDGWTENDDGSSDDDDKEVEVAKLTEEAIEVDTSEPIDVDAHEEDDDASIQHNSDLLAKEAKYLEAQYDYLVSRAQSSRSARQSVKAKRRSREDQEQITKKTGDNGLLTQLVAQQQVYMDNFKAMLAFAPVNDIRMALMTPIESYIHLGRDFDERRRTILELREEKLNMTYNYIEEKARGIDPTQPYQYSDIFERFGKYYSVHFAVSKYEGVEVGQVVKVVYDQMAGHDESIAAAMGCLTIRESYDSIKCNFLHQRIVSSLKWSEEFEEGLPELESNSLFFCRFVGDTAVFATDYIDKDDLHPYQSKDRIRKDVSSGVVLSAYTDENGKRSVIMKKFLMAKFHMYPHNLTEKMSSILFNKIPTASQKMNKLIDDKLSASRDAPLAYACEKAQSCQPPQQPHVPQQC